MVEGPRRGRRQADRRGRRPQLSGLRAVPDQLPHLERWFPRLTAVVEGAARGAAPLPGVSVVAAPADGDDAIVQVVRDALPWERVLVVTADRGLRERVTSLGATVTGPRWLLSQLWCSADVPRGTLPPTVTMTRMSELRTDPQRAWIDEEGPIPPDSWGRETSSRRALPWGFAFVIILLVVGRFALTPHLTAPALQTWATVFVAICVQALPFLVFGVVLSAAITAFVPASFWTRALPRHPAARRTGRRNGRGGAAGLRVRVGAGRVGR